ncbi:MAG: hypothetical protein KDA63_21135 [Planctomycetales bacterium]|nr:hypothetical protein [Planctomycetales bacterium]
MPFTNTSPANSAQRAFCSGVAATVLLLTSPFLPAASAAPALDLHDAVIVVRPGELANAERSAATVLSEEVAARTGLRLDTTSAWPSDKPVIAITSQADVPGWGVEIPWRETADVPERQPEGYRLLVDDNVVWLIGATPRGTLYATGEFLRRLNWDVGKATLPARLDVATAPRWPIRGHQLGYRAQANSWDAWTPEQFDQYIRELAFFGINSVENIPFHDDRPTPVMKVSRREMNQRMSEICNKYGLDYWVWTPADFDLSDDDVRAAALDQHEQLYRDCKQLTGVFFPGGDPGENPPELVLPFLEDVAARLLPLHPDARVWLSLQWFNAEQIEYISAYIERESPDWLGGLVAGPSAPPIPVTRALLPEKYRYRLYPDITHNKLCQYPVPWWDQAFALTLGREAINPRPTHYAYIHNWFAPYSDGFISYSDGVHDDVNKAIWSSLSWDPGRDPRDVLIDYCRVYFHPRVAKSAADAILALERNWQGPLQENGGVEATLATWQTLERQAPQLVENWRWQMCLVRAYYDAYVRHRLIRESRLEAKANEILARCEDLGTERAMKRASAVLNRVDTKPADADLRERISSLCEDLYESCGLQTSVSKYHAIGGERGAILDYVDYPLNNRWWLQDEFESVRRITTEVERCRRLRELADWEHPGEGSFYDDVGNPAKSPHVRRRNSYVTLPGEDAVPLPTRWWWDNGFSRARLSWQDTMNYPDAVVYEGLDPSANYVVRMSGFGRFLLRIDGELLDGDDERFEMGEICERAVPGALLADRRLELTWDSPSDEGDLNWRKQSRLAEVWLIKQ